MSTIWKAIVDTYSKPKVRNSVWLILGILAGGYGTFYFS